MFLSKAAAVEYVNLWKFAPVLCSPSDPSNWTQPHISPELSPCLWWFLSNKKRENTVKRQIHWLHLWLSKLIESTIQLFHSSHLSSNYWSFNSIASQTDSTQTCFSSSSRPSRRATHRHSKSLGQSNVAAIGQRCNDKSFCTAKKFVLVQEVHVCDGN